MRIGGSDFVALWGKSRTYSESEAKQAHAKVLGGRNKPCTVTSYGNRLHSSPPPVGMNTVMLLKLAANSLGLSPHKTMEVAERLYIAGYISYPRTESTAFSTHFDVHMICVEHASHPEWGKHAAELLGRAAGAKVAVPRTKGGVDAGDHPPITPTQSCTRSHFKNSDEYRMYDLISRFVVCIVSSTPPNAKLHLQPLAIQIITLALL